MQLLTRDQESDLIQFVIEDFGRNLSNEDFADAIRQMLEDVSGFEAAHELCISKLIAKLWKIYCLDS